MEQQKHVKIGVPVTDGAVSLEWVWAIPQPDGSYKVDSIPFFADDLNYGDHLHARPRQGRLYFEGIAERSGYKTYRMLFPETMSIEQQKTLMATLRKESQAGFERANPSFVVASVAALHEEALFRALDRLYRANQLDAWECADDPEAWGQRLVGWLGEAEAELWLAEDTAQSATRH